MKSLLPIVLVTLVFNAFTQAQQNNSAEATQIVNEREGPTYPITNVALPVGVPIPIVIQGEAQVPFVTFLSSGLAAVPSTVLGGQIVDLDMSQPLLAIYDGLSSSFYATDALGNWKTNVTFQESIALNQGFAAQTMVAAPSTPEGARLTAAHAMFIAAGITTIDLSLSDDGTQSIDLAPYGISLPYYGRDYSSFNVTANGLITFESSTGDFTPTPEEFLEGMPRIAMYWTDLSPNLGGRVTVEIDPTGPHNVVRVAFDSVPEYAIGGDGQLHTFSASISAVGDILISNRASNLAPLTATCLQGITPGGITPEEAIDESVDFSDFYTNPFTSAQNAAIYEWFGTVGNSNWTEPITNRFDLSNRQISFSAVSPRIYHTSLVN